MPGPVSLIAIFEPKVPRFDEFIAMMGPMIEASRSEPGCSRYDLFKDESGRLFLLEEYVDDEALEAHRQSAHFAAYRADSVDLLAAPTLVHVIRPVRPFPTA